MTFCSSAVSAGDLNSPAACGPGSASSSSHQSESSSTVPLASRPRYPLLALTERHAVFLIAVLLPLSLKRSDIRCCFSVCLSVRAFAESDPIESGGVEQYSGDTTISGTSCPCPPLPLPPFFLLFSDLAAILTVLADFADLSPAFVATFSWQQPWPQLTSSEP